MSEQPIEPSHTPEDVSASNEAHGLHLELDPSQMLALESVKKLAGHVHAHEHPEGDTSIMYPPATK